MAVRSSCFSTLLSMTGRFTAATAVDVIELDPTTGGRFAAAVREGWDILGNANGGYLMALAARAMQETAGRPPLTLTGHYLRPAPVGSCEIATTVVRSGRRMATVSATLSMDGQPTLALLGTFGEQSPGGASMQMSEPVELPPFEQCAAPPSEVDEMLPALTRQVDIRINPTELGFRAGEPSGSPTISGWFDLLDEPIDALSLLLATDAFPPPVLNSGLPFAWVPTVELTAHIRGVPEPGPLRCAFRSRFIHDGLLEEDGEIWDSTGALVAQSRQLALMPRA